MRGPGASQRFFDLMDVFLKSPLLPAYIGAAFAKRFARLALVVPPSGQLVAMTFIHNLLRRHPSCSVLVHREQDVRTLQQKRQTEARTWLIGCLSHRISTNQGCSLLLLSPPTFITPQRHTQGRHIRGAERWKPTSTPIGS